LKTEKSMAEGYGPYCLKKLKEQQEAPPEGQTTIDEFAGDQKVLENGEIVIQTGDGVYFHQMNKDSMPLLIDKEEGEKLMGGEK
jgi:hypothetical protein